MKLRLEGQVFGKLRVVSESRHRNVRSWLCLCECGNEKVVTTSNLRGGGTISCGCIGKENRKKLSEGDALKKRNKSLAKYWKSDKGKASIKQGAEKRKLMIESGEMRIAGRYRDREYFVEMNKKISPEGREASRQALIKSSRERLGMPITVGKNMKGTANCHSKYWKIKNINTGVILEGMNLSQIIRDNLELFDEDDTKGLINGHKCKVSFGISHIRRVYSKTGVSRDWKGWIYFSEVA
tara:strand:- start:375 stop:1091 length:717 start_codon:yes stop_codon:yes gene_type:complete